MDEEGVRYVHVSGELDLANVDEFKRHLEGCHNGEQLVVNVTELSFIDSTGLGALVQARNERGPDLFTVIPGPATERVVDITGLREFFGLSGEREV